MGYPLTPHVGRTSNVSGNSLGGLLVVEDEGAPELAVLLSEGVWDLHNEPMIQEHQLRLHPAPAKPSIPQACMRGRPDPLRCTIGSSLVKSM